MSFSANTASSSATRIKQQPTEETLPPLENARFDASIAAGPSRAPRRSFIVHESANDISYEPENALKQGLEMVSSIQNAMAGLQLGSKLRQQVWSKEIENLRKQALPTTLIAVCGATGAGKSSILNAVLNDNIVPTSGMRACTAVVTEISYHDKSTVDADVSFLSADEWKQELGVLLHDLVDEDGSLKRINDLKSDSGVAWHKVNAVYPSITQEKLVTMTPEQIVAFDPRVTSVLGTTKKIVAPNSRAFSEEIAKYIDSKEKNRGKKKDKKEKEGKSLMDKVREASGMGKKKERNDPNSPAWWPLIRQVNVRCRADCLATGAILVDLPGVADANAARNNIAKAYMKKCQCLWILAPITRAVDDKTARDLLGEAFKMQLMSKLSIEITMLLYAKSFQWIFMNTSIDGNYDDHTITFIASKTDDISCSEVIDALALDDDPELEGIEEELDSNKEETKEYTQKKKDAKKAIQTIENELKELRKQVSEYDKHLEAVKNGEPFTPTIKPSSSKESKGKKRKNKRGGKKGSPKRRRSVSSDGDDDDIAMSDDDSDSSFGYSSDSDSDSDASDKEHGSDGSDSDDSDARSEIPDVQEEFTEEILKSKIKEVKDAIKDVRVRLSAARKERKDVDDHLASLGKSQVKIQKRKNAFCSLRRSEFSRDVLKQDFRTGLKDLDGNPPQPMSGSICLMVLRTDAAAEERDPDNFDPSKKLRDYDKIDLPVFTCSSRDYVRLNNSLRQQWESKWPGSKAMEAAAMWQYTLEDDPFTIKPERQELGNGVAPRLAKEFISVIDKCVEELQGKFKDGLEGKCRTGAELAASSAVATVDEFAASMHWGTYRATLRRLGSFRRDLNIELLAPFTRNIASAWSKVFESDLFGPFEASAIKAINSLLNDVEESAALGLKDRVKIQGEMCVQDAKVALTNSINVVKETMNEQQKEISRLLAPHVQTALASGYEEALEFRGTGSVRRQKDFFHKHVDDCKHEVFEDGVDTVMERLEQAAEAVGKALEERFEELAVKIEVDLSVLWESVSTHDPQQVLARSQMVDLASEVLKEISLWNEAERTANTIDVDMSD
ncbi:hypothetical protein AAF712_002054 [Marasmius tenuissimus]|uniref:Nuclear GTPase SLIP-GC n=1 Tax=Marasmius tenuissimus TaxID=585030 RepID=A0ABR3ACW4_9AGAR